MTDHPCPAGASAACSRSLSAEAEERVRGEVARAGPLAAFARLRAENDALIRGLRLDNGREITAARTAIYTALIGHWAAEQHGQSGYDKPFAVVALGGTGRAEVTPCSDLDFAFLFDDVLEGNPFLLRLQDQLLNTDAFRERFGFACAVLPFNYDDVLRLANKQLNSFLDLRPVYDPHGLAAQFRDRIRATFDPFEHFLHVRGFWKEKWEPAARAWERLDRFDIKNDGLRAFLAGVWTLAGPGFLHSHQVYRDLEDPRDLDAYSFLLRVRCFVHARRPPAERPTVGGDHLEDVLGFEDFDSFGAWLGPAAGEQARFEFANEVRARILSARRRVARFALSVIERELQRGREVSRGSPMVCGVSGLSHRRSDRYATPREQSRAALGLVLASQRYGVPIDPAEFQITFRNAGDWLVRVPELSALFYEQAGSLAASFDFLSQFDGAEDRLFPGYAKFEASLDARVMVERKLVRAALERQKTRTLERWVREGQAMLTRAVSAERAADRHAGVSVPVEAALLDADHLAAVKLALKTKRLPVTADDPFIRGDETRPLHERFASGTSGIAVEQYYEPYRTECDFTAETVRTAEFLVTHRRTFKEHADADLNPDDVVEEFARLCGDEQTLRALFVFTCADRAEWESERDDPTRWFNTRELYSKAMVRFRPGLDPRHALETAGFARDQLEVLRDFGPALYTGVYGRYADRFGSHLVRLAEEPACDSVKVGFIRQGASNIIGVAARDVLGLAACITGALWHLNIGLRQAHLFSAMQHRLALDFFHVVPGEKTLNPELARSLEAAIRERRHIADEDEASLPAIHGTVSLQEWRQGQYCLRFETAEDTGGVLYVLTYRVFRHLAGNIFGLAGHSRRGRAYVSVYLSLPADRSFGEAHALVDGWF